MEVPLTQNKIALVDHKDYDSVMRHKWWARNARPNCWYAERHGDTTVIKMHQYVLNYFGYLDIDHKDGYGLNNTRDNLRICSRSSNMANSLSKRGTSMFKGVRFHKQTKKWTAQIMVSYVSIYLGSFTNEIDAAIAYNNAATRYFGEFAKLNEI